MPQPDPDTGGNLADSIPQVARRARAYRLEDDGASGLALRKRHAKGRGDVVERHQRAIAALEKRQAGGTALPPLQPGIAEQLIATHRKAIRGHESGLDAVAPAVNIVAPVARRVAREDRRRARKAKAQDQSGPERDLS